jgi:hypothetical protein
MTKKTLARHYRRPGKGEMITASQVSDSLVCYIPTKKKTTKTLQYRCGRDACGVVMQIDFSGDVIKAGLVCPVCLHHIIEHPVMLEPVILIPDNGVTKGK